MIITIILLPVIIAIVRNRHASMSTQCLWYERGFDAVHDVLHLSLTSYRFTGKLVYMRTQPAFISRQACRSCVEKDRWVRAGGLGGGRGGLGGGGGGG